MKKLDNFILAIGIIFAILFSIWLISAILEVRQHKNHESANIAVTCAVGSGAEISI